MKTTKLLLGAIALSIITCSHVFAQSKHQKGPWQHVQEEAIPVSGTRYIFPTKYLTFRLNVAELHTQLDQALREDDPAYVPVTIVIPKPDGSFGTYRVYENTTMSEGLAAQFPEIRSFDGVPMDGSGEMVKLDLTPQGFHAMIMIPGKSTVFIDPYTHLGDTDHYIVYNRSDFHTDKVFECDMNEEPLTAIDEEGGVDPEAIFGTCQKRTYRVAIAATIEYTNFHGGTIPQAQAAQVTTMNRVNGVYMRDMAVTMTIIANNNLIVYAGTDPYSNGNPGAMINENQTNITNVIGSANYDIGHVFGTNSGGLAGLGVVCSSGNKARGVTGSGAPVGDPFDIDYVAHEMGHQFACPHTFRGNQGSCSGNANNATAMEPGSGSTIMAYAGICGSQDVQANSDDYFHGISLQNMGAFITGGSHTCPVITAIPSQSSPNVTGTVGNVTIPASTPFALTASATDPDGDVLTYCWEQMNNESSTQPPVATATGGPNFRSFDPTPNPTRYFPSIPTLMANGPFTWERLPTVSRTMNFRVVVRDNEINGGCNDHEDITVTVSAAAGPFVVNYPSATGITWPGASTQTVTWSVANTDVAPVSCANVDVMISTDGGATFTTLANDVPNDGSQDVTVPNVATTQAIIMVICANGTFFDISNNYFTITAATNDYTLALTSSSVSVCQGTNAVYTVNVGQIGGFSNPVTLSATGLPAGASASFSPNPVTPGNSSTMTISNTAAVTPGTYAFTVQGNATSGIHTIPASISVTTTSAVASTLTTPANGATNVATPVAFTWTNANAGMSFDIEIATDAAFTNVVESANNLSTTNYTATTLLPSTQYYWRVDSYNSCSAGGNSSVFSFTTSGCGEYESTDIPVAISDVSTVTVTSTIEIPSNGTITDLDVTNLTGTHTYIEDLSFTLTSPQGTTVALWTNICGNQNDFDIILDDEAGSATLPCPPNNGGSYQPEGNLSDFDGEDMQGTWTLTVTDNYNEDGGALESWSLSICSTPPVPCDNPDLPTIGGTTSFCAGSSTTLNITSGSLNDATQWQWYSGSCGGTPVGTGATLNVSSPGTYYVRGTGGCVIGGSCQSVTITQNTVNLTTSLSGGVITANQSSGTYQWVDCNNGNQPIPGATSQSYDPVNSGSYAVQVTAANGCSGTSSCVNYSTVGMDEIAGLEVQLYPNPTSGLITVQFSQSLKVDEMNVTDVTGRLIRTEGGFTAEKVELDLSKESKGVYFLNVRVGTQMQTLKITKQ